MNHVKHVCRSIVFIQFSIIPHSKWKQIEFADPCEFVHKYLNPSSILYIVHLNRYRTVGLSKHCALGSFACDSNVIGSMSMFTFSHAVIWALFAIVIVGFPFFACFFCSNILWILSFKSHEYWIYLPYVPGFSWYIDIWWTSVCFLWNSSIGYWIQSLEHISIKVISHESPRSGLLFHFNVNPIVDEIEKQTLSIYRWTLNAECCTLYMVPEYRTNSVPLFVAH